MGTYAGADTLQEVVYQDNGLKELSERTSEAWEGPTFIL